MNHLRRTISFFLVLAASVATTFPLGILLGGIFSYLDAKAGRIKYFGKMMDPWDAAGEGAMWTGVVSFLGGVMLGIGAGVCLKVFSLAKPEEFGNLKSLWIGLFGFAFGVVFGIFFAPLGPMALVMVISGLILPFTVRLGESLLQKSSQ